MIITCNAIFPGEVYATLFEYFNGLSESCEHIIYAQALTTEVAFYVLNYPVIGIITEESSFATHGANILRSYFMKTDRYIVWVSGVSLTLINEAFGNTVIISINGFINTLNENKYTNKTENSLKKKTSIKYLPQQNRSLLEYNTSDKSYSICYWPHREFSFLTFSIMSKGLLRNMKLFNIDAKGIFLDDKGRDRKSVV